MNWLYFFIGVTAAWVFMGIFIFLLDLIRKPQNNQQEVEEQLIKFWDCANKTAAERNRILEDILTVINDRI